MASTNHIIPRILEGRLAFASGLQGYRAQLAWAESVLAKARRKEKT